MAAVRHWECQINPGNKFYFGKITEKGFAQTLVKTLVDTKGVLITAYKKHVIIGHFDKNSEPIKPYI
jgi:hypothetical protein